MVKLNFPQIPCMVSNTNSSWENIAAVRDLEDVQNVALQTGITTGLKIKHRVVLYSNNLVLTSNYSHLCPVL